MANVFKPKRSNTASSVPTISDLVDGELAVNSADQKIYLRDGASVVEVGNVAAGGGGISNLVEDTTPQLGGDLDVNGNNITGTGNVNLTGVVTATSFNGDITGDLTGNADTATTSTNVTVADESTDTTCFPVFVTAASGDLEPKSGSNLTFNSSNGTLTATSFSGDGSSVTNVDASTLVGVNSTSFLRSDAADQKTSGTLRFNDNVILSLGSGDDAEFFVDGSDCYLDLNSGIGNFYIRDGTTTRFTFDDAGEFTATGNVTAYSDITLKKNIELIPNALDKVLSLRGVTYNRIDIEDEPRHSGVIAQEVEEVLPEVVMTDEDGIKSVAYGNMVGLLIEAIKDQQNQINKLKEELEDFKR